MDFLVERLGHSTTLLPKREAGDKNAMPFMKSKVASLPAPQTSLSSIPVFDLTSLAHQLLDDSALWPCKSKATSSERTSLCLLLKLSPVLHLQACAHLLSVPHPKESGWGLIHSGFPAASTTAAYTVKCSVNAQSKTKHTRTNRHPCLAAGPYLQKELPKSLTQS